MTAEHDPLSSLDETRRAVRLAALCILGLVAAGFVCIAVIRQQMLWANGMFYSQFSSIEPPALLILAGFAIAVLWMLRRPPSPEGTEVRPWWSGLGSRHIVAVAVAVLVITVTGTWLVFHNYAFIDDEYSGWFQAVIYSRGARSVTLSPQWCQWIASMTPTSIAIVKPCTWQLSYLPIHAAIRGAFLAAHLDAFAEPTMAALSVVLLYQIVRRVWPDRPDRAALSVLYFAASTQFLLMSMTAYAMVAHLFFSLVWLWFYVRPERWAIVVLPWIGVLALGVHSPYPHVLFAAPLMLRYLVEKRLIVVGYLGVVYFLGMAYWIGRVGNIPVEVTSVAPGSSAAVLSHANSILGHVRYNGMTTAISLSLFADWSVPIVLLCALTSLILWSRLDGFARYLGLSLIATLAGRAILFDIQGAGWGYRFGFAVLGNLAVLAALGSEFLLEALGRRRTLALISVGLGFACLVLLPLRAYQARRIENPYYEASAWMSSLPADVVVFPARPLPFGSQLIRNDPFLRYSPKIMEQSVLGDSGLEAVQRAYPGRVTILAAEDFARFHLGR